MKQYLLSVVVAAIIGGLVTKLLGEKGTQGAVVKLAAGLFLAFTIIAPLRSYQLMDFSGFSSIYASGAEAMVADGKNQARQALQESIKQRCEAYILDKAQSLNVELDVEVTVSDDDIPVPESVRLVGPVSPDAKTRLTRILTEDLGISKEEQTWI